MPELAHLQLALFLGGERAHDRRLDQRHQCHVGIGRNRNGAQKMRSQDAGDIDGCRSIRATDNPYSGRLGDGELHEPRAVEKRCTQNGAEDTELCRRAQQHGFRVRQQWPEVRHGANAHEDDQRRNATADGHLIEGLDNARGEAHVARDLLGTQHRRGIKVLVGGQKALDDLWRHLLPHLVAHIHGGGERRQNRGLAAVDRVLHRAHGETCLRQVRQDGAEADRHQKQRLELFVDCEVEQPQAHHDHRERAWRQIVQTATGP